MINWTSLSHTHRTRCSMHGQTAATLRRAPISRLGLTCSLSAPALLSLAVGHLSAASSCTAFSVPISLRPVTACQLRGSAFVTRNRRTETRHIEQAPKTNLLRMQTQETVSPPARVKVVVISGPTAVGKSALAESIAKGIPGGAELISADSVQVYRGMDIGSAKPTPEERSAVKYHLIDVVDPPDEYNAANFAADARETAEQVASRGALPIVVGGTGFYLQWLVFGNPGAPPATTEATARAESMIESFAGDWVAAKCAAQEIDAVYCGTVLKDNDWFRLKRVFEVHYTCGQPLSSFERPQGKNLSPNEVAAFLKSAPFDFRCFFLYRNRIDIFADIDLRCEKMLEQGFVQECIALVRAGCLRLGATDGAGAGDQGAERIAERAIGYRQALEMLCKWKQLKHTAPDTLTPEVQDRLVVDFIREFQSASRQFVKRQLSWFRSDPTFKWVLAKDRVAAEHEVLRLVQLEEEAFQRLYSDSVEAQLQHDARAAESSKEEQNALKRYQTQLAIFASPASRLAIAETIHAAVLSLPS